MAFKRIEYSQYQLDIFDAVENGSGNIAINAVAGSGKTTTIVSACKRLRESDRDVMFMAFNKLIADELKERLRGYAQVSTLHAFGYGVLRRIYNNPEYGQYIRVDSWKWQKYVQANVSSLSSIITPDTDKSKVFAFCMNVSRLYALARVNLIEHSQDSEHSLRMLCDHHNLVTLFDEVEACDAMLEDAYRMPSDLVIDYTDMVVLPLFHREHIPSYRYVFVDECQDLNRAQRELMLCAARGGRFIAVGDRNQAINGFAGADCNSFDRIASQTGTVELPLSVNYRCGTSMVSLAREIVPGIMAHEGAEKGRIYHVKQLSGDVFTENCMVLCRTTAPLVALCMKLIEAGITAVVKGKDIGQELKTLVENANTSDIDALLAYLGNEKEKLVATIRHDRKCDEATARNTLRYHNLEDRCKCIENICRHSVKSTRVLRTFIDRMFTDERMENAVLLSTAHKSKGLEANRVVVILPHKMPLTWHGQQEWQLRQENNLRYVVLTRARKELIFVEMTEADLLRAEIKSEQMA